MNTRTQYMNENITLRPQEHFLSEQHQQDVTMFQKPHVMGGYGMTPNTIAQISDKVVMTSRILGLFDSLPPDEQNLWFPNQVVHDPDTWTVPHLLQLKSELIRMLSAGNVHKTILLLHLTSSYYPYITVSQLSSQDHCTHSGLRSNLSLGILDRFCRRLNVQIMRNYQGKIVKINQNNIR